MNFGKLIISYGMWHYTRALSDLLHNYKSLIWFLYNFFSIPLLLNTFFAPWKRMSEARKKGFDPGDFFEKLIVNTVMRVVGVLCRTIIIAFGAAVIAGAVILEVIFFFVWLAAPVLIVALFINGFALLF